MEVYVNLSVGSYTDVIVVYLETIPRTIHFVQLCVRLRLSEHWALQLDCVKPSHELDFTKVHLPCGSAM